MSDNTKPSTLRCSITGLSTNEQKLEVMLTFQTKEGVARPLTPLFSAASTPEGGIADVKRGRLASRAFKGLEATDRLKVADSSPAATLDAFKTSGPGREKAAGLEWLACLVIEGQATGKVHLTFDDQPVGLVVAVGKMLDSAVAVVPVPGEEERPLADVAGEVFADDHPLRESFAEVPKSAVSQTLRGLVRVAGLERFFVTHGEGLPAKVVLGEGGGDTLANAATWGREAYGRLGRWEPFKKSITRLFPELKPKSSRRAKGAAATVDVNEVRRRIADCPHPVIYKVRGRVPVDSVIQHKVFGTGLVNEVVGNKARVFFLDPSGVLVPKTLLCAAA